MIQIPAAALGAMRAIGVRGAVIIGLSLMVAVQTTRLYHCKGDLEAEHSRLMGEQLSHQITRQSVQTLEESLAKFVGAGQASRVAQLASLEQVAKTNAPLLAQVREIRAEVAAMKPRTPEEVKAAGCVTPRSVLNAKGL